MTLDRGVEDELNSLIDEIYRLNGRLIAAAKMTTQVAGLRPPHWVVLTAVGARGGAAYGGAHWPLDGPDPAGCATRGG